MFELSLVENPVLNALYNELLREQLLEEASRIVRTVPGCVPPSPRLVGIEPNPGPGPSRSIKKAVRGDIKSMISQVGYDLGSAIARTKKKKKTTKKKASSGLVMESKFLSAPVSSSVALRASGSRTNIFSVPLSTVLCQVYSDVAGAIRFSSVGMVPVNSNGNPIVGISPFQSVFSAIYPISFGPQINRLSQSFSRYRIRPGSCKLSYRSSVTTATNGNLAIALLPSDFPLSASAPTYLAAVSSECAISCPVWAAQVDFPAKNVESVLNGGNGGLWKYCDFDGTVTQPQTRQDLMCMLTANGVSTGVSTIYGVIYADLVLEFQHLQDNLTVVGTSHKSEASSSSATSLPPIREECTSCKDIETLSSSVTTPVKVCQSCRDCEAFTHL